MTDAQTQHILRLHCLAALDAQLDNFEAKGWTGSDWYHCLTVERSDVMRKLCGFSILSMSWAWQGMQEGDKYAKAEYARMTAIWDKYERKPHKEGARG